MLELQSKHLESDELSLLSDEVRGAIVRVVGTTLQVMTRENMEVMLTDMGIDASCVSEGACEVETARNLGVNYVVSGTVVAAGDILVASVKLHHTGNGQLLSSERTQGADLIGLLNAIDPVTVKLMSSVVGNVPQPPVAAAQIVAPPTAEGPEPAAEPEPPHDPEFDGLEMTGELQSATLGKLQCISPGSFTMGAVPSQTNYPKREILHRVTLTRPFCVMEHEVTQGQWTAQKMKDSSKFSGCGDDCPVENITWYEAVEFANAMSEAEGLQPVYDGKGKRTQWNLAANGYRLLTHAEFEAAARGREAFKYSGSDDIEEVGWVKSNANATTHPVCTKQRNGYGLCDMSGNVVEWTWAVYDWGAESSAPRTDPMGPRADGLSQRITRGGSWNDSKVNATVAHGFWYTPTERHGDVGLRLARSK